MNPIKVINHGIIFRFMAISVAGFKSEKNEAAIITPAAMANMASIMFFLTFLKKKTKEAPNRVTL